MFLTHWNLIHPEALLGHDDVIVKIRYRKQANRCTVTSWKTDGCTSGCMSRWLPLPADRQQHFIGEIPCGEEGLSSNQQSFSLHFQRNSRSENGHSS